MIGSEVTGLSLPPRAVGVARTTRSAMFRAVTDGWKRYWWGTGTEQAITTSSIIAPNCQSLCEKLHSGRARY